MIHKDIERLLQTVLPTLEKARVGQTKELEELARADAERLAEKRKRLDEFDPRAAKLERRIEGTKQLATFARRAVELRGRKPQTKVWLVEGTVVDALHRPIAGARIEFAGSDGDGFRGIGNATTGNDGTFQVEVREDVILEIARGGRAIFMNVTTPDGAQRSGLGPIPPRPGSYAFDLVIGRRRERGVAKRGESPEDPPGQGEEPDREKPRKKRAKT